MNLFSDAMKMFSPFAKAAGPAKEEQSAKEEQPTQQEATGADELDTLKRQMAAMQEKLEALSRK
jgi:polyhydroxyalkanoate synthesis regulator protein